MGMFDFLDDVGSAVGSSSFQNLTGLAAAGYDIYSGLQQESQANKMYDLMFGSSAQQDAWAAEMADRTKAVYWPLETQQYKYATEDIDAMRPSDVANRDYNIQRRAEQLAQAKAVNPMLDTTELNMLNTLTQSPDDLRNRLSNQAVTGVQQSFGNAREQAARNMALSGVNPLSGQSTEYNRNFATSQALAEANARNQAATTAEDTALSRQGQALAYRAGIPLPTYQTTPTVSAGNVTSALSSTGTLGAYTGSALNTQAQQSFTGASTALNNMYMRPYVQNYMNKISGLPTTTTY